MIDRKHFKGDNYTIHVKFDTETTEAMFYYSENEIDDSIGTYVLEKERYTVDELVELMKNGDSK